MICRASVSGADTISRATTEAPEHVFSGMQEKQTPAADDHRTLLPDTISRRRMLVTSAGALVGASIAARSESTTTNTNVGEMQPHVNFALAGKSALVTGAARGIVR